MLDQRWVGFLQVSQEFFGTLPGKPSYTQRRKGCCLAFMSASGAFSMAKTRIKIKPDESKSIMGLRQLKSAFSLCLEFPIVADRKDLENLFSPLRINCCKAASQLARDVGQELPLLPA